MEAQPLSSDDSPVFSVYAPETQTLPLVFSSPHSGRNYSPAFLEASRLDPLTLRLSEDGFVDELYACAPRHGAPLLAAEFPRAFCDPNREPYELDPKMFLGKLPNHANTHSPRVAFGLGTIAKVVAHGMDIYPGKLPVSEIEERLTKFYHPYHQCLQDLIKTTRRRFGLSVLVDCHSMPSHGGPAENDEDLSLLDVVLGDCHGTSCAPFVIETVESAFQRLGYHVSRNAPYAGGYTTRHYGRPYDGYHTLQIELNRSLYMNETTRRKTGGFALLEADLDEVIASLGAALLRQMSP